MSFSTINNGSQKLSAIVSEAKETPRDDITASIADLVKSAADTINIAFLTSKVAIKNAFIPEDERNHLAQVLDRKERDVRALETDVNILEEKLRAMIEKTGNTFDESIYKAIDRADNFSDSASYPYKINNIKKPYSEARYDTFYREMLQMKIKGKKSMIHELKTEIFKIKYSDLNGIVNDEKKLDSLIKER